MLYIYIYIHTHTHVYIYIYVYIHIYIHRSAYYVISYYGTLRNPPPLRPLAARQVGQHREHAVGGRGSP